MQPYFVVKSEVRMKFPRVIALSVLAIGLSACTDDPGSTIDPLSPADNTTKEEQVLFSSVAFEPVSIDANLITFRGRAYGTAMQTSSGDAAFASGPTAQVALSPCS